MRIARILAALAIVASLGIAAATPAQASHAPASCPGSQIAQVPIYDNFGDPYGVIAFLNVYESSGNGGTKCVKLVKVSALQGSQNLLIVAINRADGDTDPGDWDSIIADCHNTIRCDEGDFYVYAGAAFHYNVGSDCIDLYGRFVGNGTEGTDGAASTKFMYNVYC